jgi:septal ring factor EnvC (AmiA/AmiB activator)
MTLPKLPGIRRACLAAALPLLLAVVPLTAQQNIQRELRASQLKLDSIQAERERLQREMESLRSRVRDTSRELVNIERQREVSRSALLELEFQSELLTENVATTTADHEQTQVRLRQRSVDRDARLREIYKRGPLHAVQVLLTAQTFGDLLSRYKYLHLMAMYDRMIVEDVAQLERQLFAQEQELRESLRQLDGLKQDKFTEVTQLERVELQRQSTLRQFRAQETSISNWLTQLEREQTRVASVVADLERRRREEEANSATPSQPGSITTRALGTLAWPVEGNVVYRFGPDRKPDGIVLRNQGIGIGAPAGTPVKAVESGTVEFAGAFPGYGPTVIVSHGGGYRTLYLYLKNIGVQVSQQVNAGDVIGTVGGEQSADGPHIEFQVRVPREGNIEPVDPLAWLRARAGT